MEYIIHNEKTLKYWTGEQWHKDSTEAKTYETLLKTNDAICDMKERWEITDLIEVRSNNDTKRIVNIKQV